jgi:ABC-2 type transport system ATP-binding protein
MKRRLELAAALVHDPDLLVVDEPTAGIDPVLRKKFWDHFHALRGAGKTIIVTSQYLIEAEYCDQVGILGQGQLVAQGTPQEVRERAYGGEIVDVVADALDRRHVALLGELDGVRSVRPLSYEQLQVTVDRAADAIPQILERLNESGAGVKQVEEYRPDFDEVFVRLMEQANVQSAE